MVQTFRSNNSEFPEHWEIKFNKTKKIKNTKKQAVFINQLGLYYHSNKQYQKALVFFKKARQLNPAYESYTGNILYCLSAFERFDEMKS